MDIEVLDGVSLVRFDHPPVNAMDLELCDATIATMQRVDGPVVITGAGKCFSAGVDLRALLDGGADYTERFLTALSAAFLAVFDHPAPVVAAVNGHAIAGGCVFAMCADIRLMSAGTIGLSELMVGVPFPVAPLEICRHTMGTAVTRAALQANTIDAATASARGWIDEVVAPGDLIEKAIDLARQLGEHSPSAYAGTKERLHQPTRAAIDAGAETDAAVRASWVGDETRACIKAFVDSLAR